MARHDEGGFTLIELTVVVALISIATFMTFTFLDHTTSVTARAANNVFAENDARLALRVLTQDIRAAQENSITTCDAARPLSTCLRFVIRRPTTDHPLCRSVMTYWRDGSEVRSSRADSGCAVPISYTAKVVMEKVADGPPLFAYYDGDGKVMTSNQRNASTVLVTLNVQYQRESPVLRMTSYAALRNSR